MPQGPTAPLSERAVQRIGKYRILRQIAQGGMAEIYLATASGIEGFEKVCVLKRILPLLATNQEFVQMFLDEARIAASLQHSNIAQVFDIGSEQGNYYFAMEFLRGEDVRHILESALMVQTFIPYEHTVSIITGVCAGLHYAHEMRGKDGKPLCLVHRDISPQNIFVTHDGNVKLCDFGIAKSSAQLTETRVGTLKGKIRYMSPEQCRSEPLDRRSDVFSLSIVLWEMLTLRRLFPGKSDFETCKAIVEERVPAPSGFRRDVPPGLEAIVMKGLSRHPDERFQTAQELQLALEDWARANRIPASPVRLAAFMSELFGPPEPMPESFLEQVTEDHPIARHIRSLNEPEASRLVDGDRLTVKQRVARVPDAQPARLNDGEATATSKPRKAPAAGDDPESDAAAAAVELEASVNLTRPAPRWLVAGALLACVAALIALVLPGRPALDPATLPAARPTKAEPPTTIAPTLPAQPTRATTPSDTPISGGLRVPAEPPIEPQPPAVEPQPPAVGPQPQAVGPQPRAVGPQPQAVGPQPQAVGPGVHAPTPVRPARSPVAHVQLKPKRAKKADPPAAKKHGDLDDLLPP